MHKGDNDGDFSGPQTITKLYFKKNYMILSVHKWHMCTRNSCSPFQKVHGNWSQVWRDAKEGTTNMGECFTKGITPILVENTEIKKVLWNMSLAIKTGIKHKMWRLYLLKTGSAIKNPPPLLHWDHTTRQSNIVNWTRSCKKLVS